MTINAAASWTFWTKTGSKLGSNCYYLIIAAYFLSLSVLSQAIKAKIPIAWLWPQSSISLRHISANQKPVSHLLTNQKKVLFTYVLTNQRLLLMLDVNQSEAFSRRVLFLILTNNKNIYSK